MGLRSAEARLSQQELQKPQTALSRDTSLEQRLREFMRSREDWGEVKDEHTVSLRRQAFRPGVEGPELALEINPVDGQGQPKKRGYMVRGNSRVFSDQRLVKLVEILEAVNPKAVKSNSRLIEV